MPLHLLGKKSWNVYNTTNIAKVKHDEAQAAAREAAEEQRMQEADAEHQIQLLRGHANRQPQPPPPPSKENEEEEKKEEGGDAVPHRERKRRRIAGENDTDRDIRYAREKSGGVPVVKELRLTSQKSGDAPLTDHRGHINLFPAAAGAGVENSKRDTDKQKHPDVEAEKARKQREAEDGYRMRFSNAAGRGRGVGERPWYFGGGEEGKGLVGAGGEGVGRDVWGNVDEGRKGRECQRLEAEDPLSGMRRGVAGVREVERQRERWRGEREREVGRVERGGGGEERKRRRGRKREGEGGLEGFRLDGCERRLRSGSGSGSGSGSRSRDGDGRRSHHHRHRHHHQQQQQRRRRASPGWEPGAGGRYSSQFASA